MTCTYEHFVDMAVFIYLDVDRNVFPLIVHNSRVETAVTMMTYGASSEPFYHQM